MENCLQIFLRDRNSELVNEWIQTFTDCQNVNISCGDIFAIKADAIISPANSFGFMDGGIDLAYSEYFGWKLQESLQEKIREDFNSELPVGLAAIVPTENSDIKYLVSCPTMRIPEDVSNTVNAYLAFRAGLLEVINFNNNNSTKIESILCPGLGTLTGRISATNCAKQMKHAYELVFNKNNSFPNSLWTARDLHNQLRG